MTFLHRDKYRPLALDFDELEIPQVLAKLPLIGKSDVREGGRSLISERRRGPLFSGSTSGTTGAPLSLYQDLAAVNRENAFIWRQLAWAGLRRGRPQGVDRGDMIVPATQERPPYWRVNRAENMLMLSSYHLSESAAGPTSIRSRFRPGGDPGLSVFHRISRHLDDERRVSLRRKFAPRHRDFVGDAFGCAAPEIEAAFGCRVSTGTDSSSA